MSWKTSKRSTQTIWKNVFEMTLKDQVEKRKRQVVRYATAKELLRFLRKHGYEETRQISSHRILTHAVPLTLVVPEGSSLILLDSALAA